MTGGEGLRLNKVHVMQSLIFTSCQSFYLYYMRTLGQLAVETKGSQLEGSRSKEIRNFSPRSGLPGLIIFVLPPACLSFLIPSPLYLCLAVQEVSGRPALINTYFGTKRRETLIAKYMPDSMEMAGFMTTNTVDNPTLHGCIHENFLMIYSLGCLRTARG